MRRVKVVIVNYNNYQETIRYVLNLEKQEGIAIDIIIVDNCSINDSYKKLKEKFFSHESVSVIQSKTNGGYAKGNNIGIEKLNLKPKDLLVISNSDLYIEDSFLFKKWSDIHVHLKDVAISSPAMYVNGKLSEYSAWKIPKIKDSLVSSLRILEKIFGDKKRYSFPELKTTKSVDCLPGSLFMISYETFKKVNFFDPNTFLYMEEVIISRKLKNLGYNNYLIHDLKYEHFVSKIISSEIPSKAMRKHLLDSTCYYHKKYDNASGFVLGIMRANYYVWIFESWLVSLFKNKLM